MCVPAAWRGPAGDTDNGRAGRCNGPPDQGGVGRETKLHEDSTVPGEGPTKAFSLFWANILVGVFPGHSGREGSSSSIVQRNMEGRSNDNYKINILVFFIIVKNEWFPHSIYSHCYMILFSVDYYVTFSPFYANNYQWFWINTPQSVCWCQMWDVELSATIRGAAAHTPITQASVTSVGVIGDGHCTSHFILAADGVMLFICQQMQLHHTIRLCVFLFNMLLQTLLNT